VAHLVSLETAPPSRWALRLASPSRSRALLELCRAGRNYDLWSATTEVCQQMTRQDISASTHLINALLVKEVIALGQLARFFFPLKVAQTDQAPLIGFQDNAVLPFRSDSHQARLLRVRRLFDSVKPPGSSYISLASDWWLCWTQQCRQEHHVLVRRRVGKETGRCQDRVIFGIATAKNIDDPATRIFRRRIVRFNDAIPPGRVTAVPTTITVTETTLACGSRAERCVFGRRLERGCCSRPNDALAMRGTAVAGSPRRRRSVGWCRVCRGDGGEVGTGRGRGRWTWPRSNFRSY